ncbi:hypothetical protein DFH06DRAFT_1342103 [Mycena polygramma]|nr:hypothetical protein DFH06DRAFT_1342103 [Mycena polygramma]
MAATPTFKIKETVIPKKSRSKAPVEELVDVDAIESDGAGGDADMSSDLSDAPEAVQQAEMEGCVLAEAVLGRPSLLPCSFLVPDHDSSDAEEFVLVEGLNPAPPDHVAKSLEADGPFETAAGEASATEDTPMDASDASQSSQVTLASAVATSKGGHSDEEDNDAPVQKTRLKRFRRRERDDDEVIALDKDDSMFGKGSGVNANLLPPPVKTRSSSSISKPISRPNAAPSDASDSPVEESPRKKQRSATASSSKGKGKAVSDAQEPPVRDLNNPEHLKLFLAEMRKEQRAAEAAEAALQTTATVESPQATNISWPPSPESTPVTPQRKPRAAPVPSQKLQPPLFGSSPLATLSASLPGPSAGNPFAVSAIPSVAVAPVAGQFAVPPPFSSLSATTATIVNRNAEATAPVTSEAVPIEGDFAEPCTESSDTAQDAGSSGDAMTLIDGDFAEPSANVDSDRPITADVYLDDLIAYKNKWDGSAECQVNDPDLQDKAIAHTYAGLPALPKREILASYTQPGSLCIQPGCKGGRVRFCVSRRAVGLTRITVSSAMSFTRDGSFVNPARVDPRNITAIPTKNSGSSMRINIDGRVAICVSPGVLSQSCITRVVETTGHQVRCHKYIYMLFHDQEWERWAAFMCLCFGHPYMYANITAIALQFGTMLLLKNSAAYNDTPPSDSTWMATNMLSPSRPSETPIAHPSPTRTKPVVEYNVKYALKPDDTIPVYNAVGRDFDFLTELPNMAAKLPLWRGEIPQGSFIVTGYTATTYQGSAAGMSDKQEHVGCNLLWIIVCGTAPP